MDIYSIAILCDKSLSHLMNLFELEHEIPLN